MEVVMRIMEIIHLQLQVQEELEVVQQENILQELLQELPLEQQLIQEEEVVEDQDIDRQDKEAEPAVQELL